MTADRYWKGIEGPPRRGARLLEPLAHVLVHGVYKVRAHHVDRIPATGPVILAPNHTGLLDGPLVYGVVRRPVHALVKKEMFKGVVGKALTSLGQIAVDRWQTDPGAVKAALAVLERDDMLAIYPEGSRGAGDFASIKPGLAYLALCTGAPVVPVACLGIRESGKSVDALPGFRARLDVVFGEPFRVDPIEWPRRRAVVAEESARMQKKLIEHLRYAMTVRSSMTGRTSP